ncbi:MAG: hypothetical protein L3J46_04015, partial [Kangiellaceae bacterium]|nr:hypothetical protein [Kangiellaceae bacterium]
MDQIKIISCIFVVACLFACQPQTDLIDNTTEVVARDLSTTQPTASDKEQFINDLIAKMTLAEKIGQMTLYSSGEDPTVPVFNPEYRDEISKGRAGAVFASITMPNIKELQGL